MDEELVKLRHILDKCCEHRPWFPDHLWTDPSVRRAAANAYLAESCANGRVWEVWRGAEVVGILTLRDIAPQLDASCHFIFFDRELRNKRALCRSVMRRAFEEYQLHALRVEVPEYAANLIGFLRKALGFRFESERWLNLADAKKASRKYQATLYDGRWNDTYLLSVTREEFKRYERPQDQTQQR